MAKRMVSGFETSGFMVNFFYAALAFTPIFGVPLLACPAVPRSGYALLDKPAAAPNFVGNCLH
jgi:hypothetical protein